MAQSVDSPEDVVNLALVDIGHRLLVGSLFDGSEAAKLALNIYGETRDELLTKEDWKFARRDAALTLLKSAPPGGYLPTVPWSSIYPPIPWKYEYAYPADCLRLRSVRKAPIIIPEFQPQPVTWSLYNDGAKTILCNSSNLIGIYTGRVTDPTQWEPRFIAELAATLGRRLAAGLANLDAEKVEGAVEASEAELAERRRE